MRFRLRWPIEALTTCDCSLCARRNALMTKAPEAALTIEAGEALLTLYEWNTKRAKHYFCRVCGIYLFHRKRAAPDHFGVNIFCLEGVDPADYPVRATEGVGMTLVDPDAPAHWPGPRPGTGGDPLPPS